MFTLFLLFVLLALAGVIAYAGDRLGAWVGRRRLSVFGWRPRRTGQAVGIVAGVLIMLSTMGVLSLAFRGATGVLLRSQQTARELGELRTQRAQLEQQVVTTRAELARARATIADAEGAKNRARAARDAALRIRERILKEQDALRAEQKRLQKDNRALAENNAELALTNESLDAQNTRLSAQNAAIQGTFNDLQTRVVTLNEELQALRVRSEREAQNLNDKLAQFEAASGSELTYRQNEIVYSDLISAQNVTAISAALQAFVAGAQSAVIERGASDVELSTDQLNSLIGAVAATPGEDLVVLLAADNFVGGAKVLVKVEAYVNRKLLGQGQLIASRQLYAGGGGAPVSRSSLRAEVARLTQASVNRLQRIGLFEQIRPAPTETDIDAFVASLTRLSGPVVIGAVAREDIFVAGPADLDFIILY